MFLEQTVIFYNNMDSFSPPLPYHFNYSQKNYYLVMVKKKRQSDVHDDGSSTDSSEGALQNPTSGVGVCQHVKKSVDPTKLRKVLKASGLVADCMQCSKQGATSPAAEVKESILDDSLSGFEYDTTLWLCLKCGSQLCGRSRNQHALQHYKVSYNICKYIYENRIYSTVPLYPLDTSLRLTCAHHEHPYV